MAALAALAAMGGTVALAQTSPARGAPASPDDVPLADYLGLLGQIAPAAEAGARDYLSAYQTRCGRTIGSAELRRAMTQGEGDPVLMGLIRANHLQDAAARTQWTQQVRCSQKGTR
jgi:hypothetical protein